jgi:hypothetical protein
MQELDDYFSEDPEFLNQGNQQQQGYQGNNYQRNQQQNYQNNGYQRNNNYDGGHNGNRGNNGNYNKGNYNNSGGGNYNKGGYNGGAGGFQKKPYGGGGGGFRRNDQDVDLTNYTLYKPFSVICNDNAPPEILDRAKEVILYLINHGFTARASCVASSEKEILEFIPEDKVEVYIPWKDFDNRNSKFYFNDKVSQHIARMFHKAYDTLKGPIQAFLAKNVRMVLGEKAKSRSTLVIVWSEDGATDTSQITFKTGNVSHPIAIANAVHIPVFNLQDPDILLKVSGYLKLKENHQ